LELILTMGPRESRIIAYAPGDLEGIGVVAAAGRAGAVGVLDLSRNFESRALRDVFKRIDSRSGRSFGIRIAASNLTQELLDIAPSSLDLAIVIEDVETDWPSTFDRIRQTGRRAIAEVFSKASAVQAERAGAQGLIVAGHEAGGLVSEDSSFILLQGVLDRVKIPVWVRGGVGPQVAAGCMAAGAAGVVLDGALLLARESPLSDSIRERIARWDGSETIVVGPKGGPRLRIHAAPGSSALTRLREAASGSKADWELAVRTLVGWKDGQALPVGQDSALAGGLARLSVTTGGVIQAVTRAMDLGLAEAHGCRPLAEGSAMASSLGTRFPILQGPMTRVSDVVEFASAVADGGALPFLALAMLRGPEVGTLLSAARSALEGRPWGVGVLGFVPPELRTEQIAAILEARPPFALIAGGRPDQAAELERNGISTFLHVPSPGLLAQFLRDGSRRFVLEGRECGGHVGPRSSFVLWQQAIDILEEAIDRGIRPDEIQVVFAGGIHDGRSSAYVSGLAAPLASRGVKVGVLVGTAYLFTREAVATGAIVERFQKEAIACESTVLLETGPGHEVRVSPSPFAATFETERRRLLVNSTSPESTRELLEQLNAGRLRVAAKGVDRANGNGTPLVAVADADQFERGIYMLGQVATLRDRVTSIDDLHHSIAEGMSPPLEQNDPLMDQVASRPSDVAIVGMSANMPGAGDVRTFWENSLKGFDAITEIPADRWDWRLYYDSDPKAPDKIISKWGGFVPEIPFDPLSYGMPPTSLPSIEPVQLLLLEATRAAIEDAGYADRPFDRERTAVVLGMGGGAAQLAMGYAFRSYLPMLDTVSPGAGQDALRACEGLLPEWTEDSFPGFLLNVAAGRVANRFDFGGANYTVDAACGSSLAAASLAVRELETGSADVVILGGADTVQNPFTYLAFSKTQAFSPRGRCRPFDASADGIVISEGVAVMVLKRLADAERDGDRIYAVIKGMGAASDGRAKGLTAPSNEGQVRALKRAYAKSGVEPSTVGYVEAHGTGTAVGDVVEVNSISSVFRESGASAGSVAIGSVKSMIGHTKCAAGLAGLINATLALHHKILPPTIGVETINPTADFADGPFHASTQARPWLHSTDNQARRAGVSAFGFGGTNFHAVLEAYEGDPGPPPAPNRDWPCELFTWRADEISTLLENLDRLAKSLDNGARPALRDLSRAVNRSSESIDGSGPSLAIVAETTEELRAKIQLALQMIASGQKRIEDPHGLYYEESSRFAGQKVAFLFPGQGSQSPGMLADLTMTFPEVREAFDEFDAALRRSGRPVIGSLVYPPPALEDAARERNKAALRSTDSTQPALGAASVGLLRLLGSLGVEPAMTAGHSFGELVALHASKAISLAGLAELAHERGRLMRQALGEEPGTMAAISASLADVSNLIAGIDGVIAVNENGPRQTVVAGPVEAVEQAIERAREAGFRALSLTVAGAFHTSLMASAIEPLTQAAASRIEWPPDRPVYSNLDARPHPASLNLIAERIGQHVASPVRFASMVEAMYDDEARIFVEVGPGAVLSPLVESILGDRPHLAVSCDPTGKPGILGLLHALARLVVAGAPAKLDRLTLGRSKHALDMNNLAMGDGSATLLPTTWMVNGSRARPLGEPEPRRLGQGPALPISTKEPTDSAARNGSTHAQYHNNGSRHEQSIAPPPPSSPARPSTRLKSTSDEQVLASFQETMRTFLGVQQSTMLAYLAGRSNAVPTPTESSVPTFLPEPLADRMSSRPKPVLPSSIAKAPTPRREVEPKTSMIAETISLPSQELASSRMTSRDFVAKKLVAIVRDRTGYPAEMLGLDLDLEADLGIDSIKRVEILGTLRDAIPTLNGSTDSSIMDTLSRAKTLGTIVDQVVEIARRRESSKEIAAPSHKTGSTNGALHAKPKVASVRRLLLEPVSAPLNHGTSGLVPGGVVVVTDDGRGVARSIASELEAAGQIVVLAGLDEVDFSSPSAVEGLLDLARSSGNVAAVVHALPLRDAADSGLNPSAWSARIGPEVKGLFHLAKAAASDLERASRIGGGALVAATAMGGTFGSGSDSIDFFAGHGGIAGLVKTLAREWPEVRSRVVDLDPRLDPDSLASKLTAEVMSDDDWSEVGYLGERRVRLQARLAPLLIGSNPRIEIKPGEPILVTGGARGITATITAEIARRWKPTLLLVGRNPLPSESEDQETAGLTSPTELKSVLHARLSRERKVVNPSDLKRAYVSICQAREIRQNLGLFRSAGAVVEYAAVDVRDSEALAKILGSWRRRFGDPVGLIHGAGVIKDKLIRDKTPESFDHVLGTKLDGALNLARLLRPEAIKFAALFSSIAGRFGNVGQSDYAAANEILNKLAIWLARRWTGRVVSMIWGPWSGVGMVSDLEVHLGGRGLGMIPPEIGRSLLIDELRFGQKGQVEVIAAGDLGTLDGPIDRPRLAEVVR
jgi:acyl transferase domain-containing protein/NAD(P)H-dependent flavin oxidoreductase YrpB (nitropropane dioxygenase family)/NAD(P)-dependent dehydrogenase (short-subunit alcohol dehydrogenase family)